MLSEADLRQLEQNLGRIRERIVAAAMGSGRDPGEVSLVAITKYTGPAVAAGLLRLGQADLGENRVDHLIHLDEALERATPGPQWHMVGHLQRNKAHKVVDRISVLHSLDSPELAQRLDARRSPDLPPLLVYAEVRLSEDEQQRSGVAPDALPALLEALRGLERLRVAGLMGLPPQGAPAEARPHFQRLRGLRDQALAAGLLAEGGLSMGMTSDLEVAVAEGSTCVRIGQALLSGLSEEALGG